MTSDDVARGLCALWDHRCGQGHPSWFDIDKRSLGELHGVLEGYLREGRRPGVPVSHLRTEAPQPVPPPFHQDIFLAPLLTGGHEGQNTRWGSPGPEGSLICKQNTKGEERAKQQVTSEEGMASTWKTGRTWEGCLEEVEWEGSLKGKCRTCPQARLCQFLGGNPGV